MDESKSKVCSQCGADKPHSEYHRRAKASDGLMAACKDCRRAKNREYMRTYEHPNPAARREYGAKWRRDNAGRIADYRKKYAKVNAAAISSYMKAYRTANRERLQATKAAYHVANASRIRRKVRDWQQNNPERFQELVMRRRARLLNAKVGRVDLAALWTGCCAICGEVMDPDLRHPDPMSKSVDHIVPLARGGSHSQQNLQYAHFVCNLRKGTSLPAA